MLKVNNFEITDTLILLDVYEENSKPESDSTELEISLDDFEQWCLDKYAGSGVFYTGYSFTEWWNDMYILKNNEILEIYINRPTMPIIGVTDNEITN